MTIDYAANLALFLVEKTGSALGEWSGKMSAAEQRALFGRFIGKGRIVIDGEAETIANRVKVCFGHDYDDRSVTPWRNCAPSPDPANHRSPTMNLDHRIGTVRN